MNVTLVLKCVSSKKKKTSDVLFFLQMWDHITIVEENLVYAEIWWYLPFVYDHIEHSFSLKSGFMKILCRGKIGVEENWCTQYFPESIFKVKTNICEQNISFSETQI